MGSTCCGESNQDHLKRCKLCQLGGSTSDKRLCMDEEQFRKVVNALFDQYDPNKDGVLERHEVHAMIRDLAAKKQQNLTAEKLESYVETYMKEADTSRNGKIDKEEFYRFYKPQ